MATDTHAADAHDDHGHHGPAYLAHHFDTPVQQFDAAKLGVWAYKAGDSTEASRHLNLAVAIYDQYAGAVEGAAMDVFMARRTRRRHLREFDRLLLVVVA